MPSLVLERGERGNEDSNNEDNTDGVLHVYVLVGFIAIYHMVTAFSKGNLNMRKQQRIFFRLIVVLLIPGCHYGRGLYAPQPPPHAI